MHALLKKTTKKGPKERAAPAKAVGVVLEQHLTRARHYFFNASLVTAPGHLQYGSA
jgi:hypothetical protein